jgi:uncharacterized membrane protein
MAQVSDFVHIDAPVETVFEYMDRPENQAEITPSLTRSETVEQLDNGGKRVAYTYEMAGVSLDGHVTATSYEPGERIVFEMTGDLEGEIEWRFEPEDDGTRVTYNADYAVPVPVLETVVEPFVERYNARVLRSTLENLRERIETDPDRTAEAE